MLPTIDGVVETPHHDATWVKWPSDESSSAAGEPVYLTHGVSVGTAQRILKGENGTIVATFKGAEHPDFGNNAGKLVWFGLSTNNSYFNGRYGPIVIEVNPSALQAKKFGCGEKLCARKYERELSLPILARDDSPSIFGHESWHPIFGKESIACNWPSEWKTGVPHPEVAVQTDELEVKQVRVRLEQHGRRSNGEWILCIRRNKGNFACICKVEWEVDIHYEALRNLWEVGIMPNQVGLLEGSDMQVLFNGFNAVANINTREPYMTWQEVKDVVAFARETSIECYSPPQCQKIVYRLLQIAFASRYIPDDWEVRFAQWVASCGDHFTNAGLNQQLIANVLYAFGCWDLRKALDICRDALNGNI